MMTDYSDCAAKAQSIVRAIFADYSGGSVWVNRDDSPDRGYCVGIAGHETKFPLGADCSAHDVWNDVVGKLDWIESNDWSGRSVCIGWWEHNGIVYLDVSLHFDDLAAALVFAESNEQIAIFDIADSTDIDVRYV